MQPRADRSVDLIRVKEYGSAAILVVDDIEEVRDGLISLLESDGHRLETARSEKSCKLLIRNEL
jgi:CheY-like chemotaxis protein